MRKAILLTLATMCLYGSGCTFSKPIIPESGHFYIDKSANFKQLGKVVIFELQGHEKHPNLSRELSDSLADSLGKKHMFSLNVLHRSDAGCKSLDLQDRTTYSIDELSNFRKELKADAIIFGTITQYHPYPHFLIGVNLKMYNLKNGNLIWAMEQVWDTMDKRLERRMERYYKVYMRSGYQPMDYRVMLNSPRAFNKFVVHEISETFDQARGY
jgi:hypothetical protein